MQPSFVPIGFVSKGTAGFHSQGEVFWGDWNGERAVLRLIPRGSVPKGRILQRIEEMTQVDSVHVAPILHYEESNNGVAVVQKYISGPTLTTVRAATRGLTEGEAWRVLVDITQGLKDLHARGIIHGDLSPENIIVTNGQGSSRAVLVDAGVESDWENGTPGYRAPEILQGTAASALSDVWSAARVAVWAVRSEERVAFAEQLKEALHPELVRRLGMTELGELAQNGAVPKIALPDERTLAAAHLRALQGAERTGVVTTRRSRSRVSSSMTVMRRVGLVVTLIAITTYGITEIVANLPASKLTVNSSDSPVQKNVSYKNVRKHLKELTERRDMALATRNKELLGTVTVPGSPAAVVDETLFHRFRGSTPADLKTVVNIQGVSGAERSPTVRATLEQQPFRWDGGARDGVRVTGLPARCVEIDLKEHEQKWRVYRTRACAA